MSITLEDVRAVAAQVAKGSRRRNLEVNNDGCVYTAPNGKHCVAGEILVTLGFEVPAFGEEFNQQRIGSMGERYPELDTAALNYLDALQEFGDDRMYWREAYKYTERSYRDTQR